MKRSIIYKMIAAFDAIAAIICAFRGDAYFIVCAIFAGILWALSEHWKVEEDKQGE